jgi:large subunit ribosomal protein L23
MALFNKKTTAKAESKTVKTVKKAKSDVEVVTAEVVSTETKAPKAGKALDLAQVLIRPHVTEKASDLSERGVYAFEINGRANKMHVRQAVEKMFKVKPVKVAVLNNSPKYSRNPRTNRVVLKKAGLKKAMVYLKKGDKIEFV